MMNLIDSAIRYCARHVFVVLPAFTLLIYFRALFYPFSPMDEQWLIVQNTDLFQQSSLPGNLFSETINNVYYRPLLLFSFAIDYLIDGLNPFIYHLHNVILHAVSSILLHQLLIRLRISAGQALLWALIFVAHPLNLHAVAWIPGRNDVLLFIFTVASLLSLLKMSPRRNLMLLLHYVFFAAALLIKESAVLLPLIFIPFMIYFGQKFRQILIICSGWIIITGGWFFLRAAFVDSGISNLTGFIHTASGMLKGLLIYTGKMTFPFKQSVSPVPEMRLILPGLITIVLLVVYFAVRKKWPDKISLTGLTVFFVALILPLFFSSQQPLQELYEHRAYASLAGLLIFFAGLTRSLTGPLRKPAILIILATLASTTTVRLSIYESAESYLGEAIADNPANYIQHFYLADHFYRKKDYAASLKAYNQAIQRNPTKSELFNNRANVHVQLKNYKLAFEDYIKAYELHKEPAILIAGCKTQLMAGDTVGAMNAYLYLRKCCQSLIPPMLEVQMVSAYALFRENALNALIAEQPEKGILYVNRAKFYMEQRNGEAALADLRRACELEPGNAEFQRYLHELESTFLK